MFKNKKSLLLIGCLACNNVYATGFPMIDIAAGAQRVIDILNQVQQLRQLKDQMENTKAQFESMNGINDLSGFLDTSYDITKEISESDINQKLEGEGINNADFHGFEGEHAVLYNEEIQQIAEHQIKTEATYNQTIDRFEKLNTLVQKIDQSSDQKSILDLIARINAEGVMVQNEHNKILALKSLNQANKDILIQKQNQENIKFLQSKN